MTVAVIAEADNFLVVGCDPSFTKGHISGALKKIKCLSIGRCFVLGRVAVDLVQDFLGDLPVVLLQIRVGCQSFTSTFSFFKLA